MRSQGKSVGLERADLGRGGGRRGTALVALALWTVKGSRGVQCKVTVKEKKCLVLVVGKVKEPGE
eukprot:704817-Hanusia_phi.AAC.1